MRRDFDFDKLSPGFVSHCATSIVVQGIGYSKNPKLSLKSLLHQNPWRSSRYTFRDDCGRPKNESKTLLSTPTNTPALQQQLQQHTSQTRMSRAHSCRIGVSQNTIPSCILTPNSTLLTWQFFATFCTYLRRNQLATAACYTQRNAQVELYNETVLTRVRRNVADTQRGWDIIVHPFSHVSNAHIHGSTNFFF